MIDLADGLTYHRERWHDSNVHVLEVDLSKRQIRPIPIGPRYPWNVYHTTPPQLADAGGSIAAIGGDMGGSADSGVAIPRQTTGAFMLAGELWTSGVRDGPKFVLAGARARLGRAPPEGARDAHDPTRRVERDELRRRRVDVYVDQEGWPRSRRLLWERYAWRVPAGALRDGGVLK